LALVALEANVQMLESADHQECCDHGYCSHDGYLGGNERTRNDEHPNQWLYDKSRQPSTPRWFTGDGSSTYRAFA
jgi:hypothetical protein